MAGEQAASMQPETKSYDDDIMGDVQAAYTEAAKEAPADTVVETKEVSEPVKEVTPAEPRADHPTDKTRYADGTFKPTTDAKPAELKQAEAPKADQAKAPVEAVQQQPAQVPAVSAPPPGWSVKSKSEWDKLPEHVRADITRRDQELNQGLAQYQDLKPLRKYVDMARQRGTTLEASLERYVGIDNLCSQNLLQGLLHIAGNAGVQPQQLAQALAPYLGNQAQPDSGHAAQTPDQSVLQQWFNPLEQKVNQIQQLFTQQQQAEQARQISAINSALERFKSLPEHRYYENVEPTIIKLFEGGIVPRTGDYMADLKAAYEHACRLDPEISELLLNERIARTAEAKRQSDQAATEKAKLASRSIAGSSASSVIDNSDPDESLEETVRKAVRAHAA